MSSSAHSASPTQESPTHNDSDSDVPDVDYASWQVPSSTPSLQDLLNHERKSMQQDTSDDDVTFERDYASWEPSGAKEVIRDRLEVTSSAETPQKVPRTLGADEGKIYDHIKDLKQKIEAQREQDPDQDFEGIIRPEEMLKMSLERNARTRDEQRPTTGATTTTATNAPKMRFSLADLGIDSDTESDEEVETVSYDEWKKRHEQKKKQAAAEQLERQQRKSGAGRAKPRDLFTGLLDQFQAAMDDDRPGGQQRYTPQLSPEEHRKFLKWMFPLCE